MQFPASLAHFLLLLAVSLRNRDVPAASAFRLRGEEFPTPGNGGFFSGGGGSGGDEKSEVKAAPEASESEWEQACEGVLGASEETDERRRHPVEPNFIAAEGFLGAKEGYAFKIGNKGLGYYHDANGPAPGGKALLSPYSSPLAGAALSQSVQAHSGGSVFGRVEQEQQLRHENNTQGEQKRVPRRLGGAAGGAGLEGDEKNTDTSWGGGGNSQPSSVFGRLEQEQQLRHDGQQQNLQQQQEQLQERLVMSIRNDYKEMRQQLQHLLLQERQLTRAALLEQRQEQQFSSMEQREEEQFMEQQELQQHHRLHRLFRHGMSLRKAGRELAASQHGRKAASQPGRKANSAQEGTFLSGISAGVGGGSGAVGAKRGRDCAEESGKQKAKQARHTTPPSLHLAKTFTREDFFGDASGDLSTNNGLSTNATMHQLDSSLAPTIHQLDSSLASSRPSYWNAVLEEQYQEDLELSPYAIFGRKNSEDLRRDIGCGKIFFTKGRIDDVESLVTAIGTGCSATGCSVSGVANRVQWGRGGLFQLWPSSADAEHQNLVKIFKHLESAERGDLRKCGAWFPGEPRPRDGDPDSWRNCKLCQAAKRMLHLWEVRRAEKIMALEEHAKRCTGWAKSENEGAEEATTSSPASTSGKKGRAKKCSYPDCGQMRKLLEKRRAGKELADHMKKCGGWCSTACSDRMRERQRPVELRGGGRTRRAGTQHLPSLIRLSKHLQPERAFPPSPPTTVTSSASGAGAGAESSGATSARSAAPAPGAGVPIHLRIVTLDGGVLRLLISARSTVSTLRRAIVCFSRTGEHTFSDAVPPHCTVQRLLRHEWRSTCEDGAPFVELFCEGKEDAFERTATVQDMINAAGEQTLERIEKSLPEPQLTLFMLVRARPNWRFSAAVDPSPGSTPAVVPIAVSEDGLTVSRRHPRVCSAPLFSFAHYYASDEENVFRVNSPLDKTYYREVKVTKGRLPNDLIPSKIEDGAKRFGDGDWADAPVCPAPFSPGWTEERNAEEEHLRREGAKDQETSDWEENIRRQNRWQNHRDGPGSRFGANWGPKVDERGVEHRYLGKIQIGFTNQGAIPDGGHRIYCANQGMLESSLKGSARARDLMDVDVWDGDRVGVSLTLPGTENGLSATHSQWSLRDAKRKLQTGTHRPPMRMRVFVNGEPCVDRTLDPHAPVLNVGDERSWLHFQETPREAVEVRKTKAATQGRDGLVFAVGFPVNHYLGFKDDNQGRPPPFFVVEAQPRAEQPRVEAAPGEQPGAAAGGGAAGGE